MNVELLTEVQYARDVGDVVKVIAKHAKPFGEIRTWKFSRDREMGLLHVFVALENRAGHEELARRLGGCEQAGEVRFDIPLFIPLEAVDPTAPLPSKADRTRAQKQG